MHSKWHVSSLLKNKPLIVLAHSARTIAQAGAQAGYKVIAIDAFSDLETQAACLTTCRVPLNEWRFDLSVLSQVLDQLYKRYPQAEVVFGAGIEYAITHFDDYPRWSLCGFSASSIRLLRDPRQFFLKLDELAIPYPEVCFQSKDLPMLKDATWLLKSAQGSGGCQIRFATNKDMLAQSLVVPSSSPNAGQYLQRYIEGDAISVLVLAQSDQLNILGFNQQQHQAGSVDFPFIYLGLEANIPLLKEQTDQVAGYLRKLFHEFELTGLFSLDMMLTNDGLKVLELNPRIPASFEHYQQLLPKFNLLEAHLQACRGLTVACLPKAIGRVANRILFAPFISTLATNMEWPEWAADRPIPGTVFQLGEPICSITAKDDSDSSNEQSQTLAALLESRAHVILQQLNHIN